MRYFPLFHDTRELSLVVIGGGEVAARKLTLWSRTEARLTVIAPRVVPAVEQLIRQGRVRHLAQFYHAAQLVGHQGVIAATDDPALNRTVSDHARERSLWVNVVDDPEACSVITPALVDRAPVVVAIGSEGGAPVLVRTIRALLEGILPESLGQLARFIGEQRGRVMNSHAEPRQVWQRFLSRNGLRWSDNTPNCLAVAEAGTDMPGQVWLINPEIDPVTLPIAALEILQGLDGIYAPGAIPEALDRFCRRDAERQSLEEPQEILGRVSAGAQLLLVLTPEQQTQWHPLLEALKPGQFQPGAVKPAAD
ncbi:bifunctional precorrin-2 dehydrogenase/sirohydrochlorin ferrochelatase [Ferrimonas balearica]|uniref:precorrin-2 dehydrogenase/sirohydrochlorin ferrochelatase family protein n=1 Tax=Ferrimonas balearica TaxID=44012 RepID=UPI001C99F338|nr:bifunctional precorrin-2 dehydrogenase/sirohydrochlorin ferrochelatase [Ferrimonas balearica]MBY5921971.1 bifunctional precorrin-2 dehydrogenase/sirohydrochlorin ferrochelatase [Ferrimonas balearica]MBY5994689.1 bifunctional precorrin-2 dehydrogenase/sirohydrochlorin ferrochelatase [Ferrimonas balearica]